MGRRDSAPQAAPNRMSPEIQIVFNDEILDRSIEEPAAID
jgi:hypothetical protein